MKPHRGTLKIEAGEKFGRRQLISGELGRASATQIHLLKSSHRYDSNKWLNLGFGEEITQAALILHIVHASGALLLLQTIHTRFILFLKQFSTCSHETDRNNFNWCHLRNRFEGRIQNSACFIS